MTSDVSHIHMYCGNPGVAEAMIHNKTDDTETDVNLNGLYSKKWGSGVGGQKSNINGSSSGALSYI